MPRSILDTNFVSELNKPRVNPGCAKWIARQAPLDIWLTTVTLAEVAQGVELCRDETQRAKLSAWIQGELMVKFAGRIFDFDQKAALIYGRLIAVTQHCGQPRPILDLQIAAIALANECALVSRNTRDFSGLGVEIVNPWS